MYVIYSHSCIKWHLCTTCTTKFDAMWQTNSVQNAIRNKWEPNFADIFWTASNSNTKQHTHTPLPRSISTLQRKSLVFRGHPPPSYSMVQDIIWKADSHSACQKISCFLYGTRRFITVFTKACHWTLSWGSRIQFAPSIPISLRSILMLSSHLRLGLPSGLLPGGTPTKTL
jgi:hypothetical protein